MGMLRITDLEYGNDDQETCEFWSIFAPNRQFLVNRRPTLIDFERNFEFFLKPIKTHIRNRFA
jgi:hypothetical protein